jgi:hypothetical protein
MRQHSAEYRALVVGGDAADYDSIGAGGFAASKCTGFEDGELEVGLLGCAEGEFLVVCLFMN